MTIQEFGSLLFEMEINLHIAHLQTNSFSIHSALNIYKDLVELRDSYLEKWSGQYSIIRNYSKIEIQEGIDPIKYIQDCCLKIEEYRESVEEGYLQQMIDNILEALNGTLYFLKNLK